MNYTESADLMKDAEFLGRCKVACLKYAGSILIEPTETPAHNTRLRWAASCQTNPDFAATQVAPPTTMDPAVQSAGAAVTDTALQAACEGVINKMM